jgi:hypothetical protein
MPKWIKKSYLWILSGLTSAIITVLLVFIKIKKKQNEQLKNENENNKLKAKLGDNAFASGEVKGKDEILAQQEAIVEETIKNTEKEINEVKKPKTYASVDVAAKLNTIYGRRNDSE